MSIARKAKTKRAGCTKRLKKRGGKRDKYIFRFGRGSKRVNLLDVVLRIMEEDGPKTWPKKKTPNGADMFYEEHQAEYEARAKPASGSDPARQVEQHNSGYPKLRDELEKRRSLTKVTTALSKNIPTRDVSVTRRRRNRTKKTYTRSRNNKNSKRKVKSRDTKVKSGVKKRTCRAKCRKMKVNNSCQYIRSIEFKTCGTSYDLDLLQVLNIEPANHGQSNISAPITQLNPTCKSDKDSNCSYLNKKNSEMSKTSIKSRYYSKSRGSSKEKISKSEIDVRNPSGETSVTSYNSYLSMDHEPMD